MNERKLFSIAETAALLKISRRRLMKAVGDKEIAATYVGGRRRPMFTETSIDAYIARCTEPAVENPEQGQQNG